MAAQLIVALDLPRKEDALVLARELQGAVPWCKVGMELFTLAGPDIIRELHDLGFHVFLDMKFYDIPTPWPRPSRPLPPPVRNC